MTLIELSRVYINRASKPYETSVEKVLVNPDAIECVYPRRLTEAPWPEIKAAGKVFPQSTVAFRGGPELREIDVAEDMASIKRMVECPR